jgi:hypothetical protein
MIDYYSLGNNLQLNEIVFSGSHDAGITTGHGYDKTQELDIFGQALAGVRIFDLRITGVSRVTSTGIKVADLRTFHGITSKTKNRDRVIPALGHNTNTITTKKMRLMGGAGNFGLRLDEVLTQAKTFVENNNTEFLILKFDKCDNWLQIAEMCVSFLDNTIYTPGKNGGGSNLNRCTLDQLKGSVIVTFTSDGIAAVNGHYSSVHGIFGITSLAKTKAAYKSNYRGLQYYGSGGTDKTTRNGKEGIRTVTENERKQKKLMLDGISVGLQVMGMMYWTITGALGNIESRNQYLWTQPNAQKLVDLWKLIYLAGHGYYPNIVMIDFANDDSCEVIYRLNETLGSNCGAPVSALCQQLHY